MTKYLIIGISLVLAGCASTGKEYQQYIESTSKIQQSINASEAACLLVLAEAIKTADPIIKAAISAQIDKCKKEPPRIEPPNRGILGIFN